jgi:uncharacterized repeat protein (TIGR03803 family)
MLNLLSSTSRIAVLIYASVLALAVHAFATESVVYSFTGNTDGSSPVGTLIFDKAGNAYGVTSYGGVVPCPNGNPGGCGTVFELTPDSSGGWTENVLYSFTGGRNDGANPQAGLAMDSSGDLYGTTGYGGNSCGTGCGVVFELSRNAGGDWAETSGLDGYGPVGVTLDGSGNLYGATQSGGLYSAGVFYKLSHASGVWTESILHEFTGGEDGIEPLAQLTLKNGNLYGTTALGGAYTVGTVFMLSPTTGNWTMALLHAFTGGNDGARPGSGSLFVSPAGDVYGTAQYGGYYQFGVVFKLSPSVWNETVLYNFTGGSDGGNPTSGVIARAGNVYGSSAAFGADGFGLVFELTP